MKQFFFALILLFTLSVFGQNNHEIKTVNWSRNGESERSFWLYEEDAVAFLSGMHSKFKFNQHKFIHVFRKVTVAGISDLLQVKVHEGVHKKEGDCAGFNTFVNTKYREQRMSNLGENECYGVIIYIKNKRKPGITTKETESAFKNFILETINASQK